MFNLLYLCDTTQKLTDAWNFKVRCGLGDKNGKKEPPPLKSAAATHLMIRAFSSAALCFNIKLFIPEENASLITANDADVWRRTDMLSSERIFLSLFLSLWQTAHF